MEVLEKDRPQRLDEHLDYLNAVISFVSYMVTNSPKQEYLDTIKQKSFYFTTEEEKTTYNELLIKASEFITLEKRMPEYYNVDGEKWDGLRRWFNSLEQKLFNPLSYISDMENKIEYLTKAILEKK